MMAVKHALIYADSQGFKNPKILTDSLSSCKALQKQLSLPYITETIHEVIRLLTKTDGSIMWVPAHVGIEGNEMADQLAKDSIRNEEEIVENKISQGDCRTMMTNELHEVWQKSYNEEVKGGKFRKIMPKISMKPWYDRLKLNAEDVKTFNRLISNHSFDNRWLFRFKKVDSDLCEACNEIDTAEHRVFSCRRYSNSRRSFKLLGGMSGVDDLWNSKDRESTLTEIKKFLKENEIIF